MPSKKPVIMTYTTKETVEKFKIVADSENRTMSKHMEYIIKKEIHKYESEHGEIQLSETINNDNITQHVTNNGYMNIGIQNNQK